MVFRPLSSGAALFVLTAGAALWVSGCTSQAQENTAAQATAPATTQTTDEPKGEVSAPAATEAPKTFEVTKPSLGPSAPADVATSYGAAMKKVALPPPPADFKVDKHPRVEFDTVRGKIIFELDAEKAPMNARSFVYLASKGFYKGTRFHRQEDLSGDGKGLIIQGGDPLSANPATYQYSGMGGPSYNVPLEASNGLKHDQYVLAAARSTDPNSAGSQFYITQGETHFLDGKYTVFGKIVDGKDVAAKLMKGDKLLAVKVLEASKN
ncbi:peptidylprolyl isomerase [bacterium]|nr:MAG: peptidylprolyl isomerase [bacterium]